MKKTGLTILMAGMICTASFAGDIHKTGKQKVAYMAKQEFRSDFPKVQTVQWNRDKQYSEATFMKNDMKMHAFYNWDGNLTGTTHDFAYNNLPEPARKNIAKQYKDYTVERTIIFKDDESNLNDLFPLVPYEYRTNYFVLLKKNDQSEQVILHVTPDGNVSYFKNM